MILAWLANLNLKPMEAQYLDTFYKMLKYVDKKDIHYVIIEEYLKEHPLTWASTFLDYNSINFDELNKTVLRTSPEQRCAITLKSKLQSYNKEHNESIYQQLKYDTELKREDIDFILTWINNRTLKNFAKHYNIPLIHNELGALRPNLWKDSIYLDFSGVNDSTEFEIRFKNFMKVSSFVNILPHDELLELVAGDKSEVFNIYKNYFNRTDCNKVGVALQVARDSNLLMYSHGWSTIDLMSYVCQKYGKENLLVKNHPHSDQQQTGDYAFVSTPTELLMRSKKVVTVNSSMAFEAFLLGKEAEVLGSNPFECIFGLTGEDKLKALNFAVISYLVPEKLLFNKDYYKFRIECKDEVTLFNEGLRNWKNYAKLR